MRGSHVDEMTNIYSMLKLAFVFLVVSVVGVINAQASKRVALVVGNGALRCCKDDECCNDDELDYPVHVASLLVFKAATLSQRRSKGIQKILNAIPIYRC